jgi:hypothetical protein
MWPGAAAVGRQLLTEWAIAMPRLFTVAYADDDRAEARDKLWRLICNDFMQLSPSWETSQNFTGPGDSFLRSEEPSTDLYP